LFKLNDSMNIVFTDHAVQQIFERNLFEDDVILAVFEGEVIKEYPNDKPYSSVMLMIK